MPMKASEQFRVNEDGVTADGYHALDPAAKKAMYLAAVIEIAILAVIMAVAWVYLVDGPEWIRTVVVIALAILIVILAVYPSVYYARYRYRIDDEKVEVRKGVIIISHSLIPIERIHQVTVTVGPINGLFGLADVNIITAGGSDSIEHLKNDVAESIAARLNEVVVGILKERD